MCLSHSVYMHHAPQTAWLMFVDGLNDAQGRGGEGLYCVVLALFLSLSEPQCLNSWNGEGYCAQVTMLQGLPVIWQGGAQHRPPIWGPLKGYYGPSLVLPAARGIPGPAG